MNQFYGVHDCSFSQGEYVESGNIKNRLTIQVNVEVCDELPWLLEAIRMHDQQSELSACSKSARANGVWMLTVLRLFLHHLTILALRISVHSRLVWVYW